MDLFLGLLFLTYMVGGFLYSCSILGGWVDNGRTPTNGNIVILIIFLPLATIVSVFIVIFMSLIKMIVLLRRHFPKLWEWWKKPIR